MRGVSTEGLAREFLEWHQEHRPDLPWTSAFPAWREAIGGLPSDLERAVRVEVVRLRVFGARR